MIENLQSTGIEANRTFRIEHLSGLTVIENLDYPVKGDREDIFEILKKYRLDENLPESLAELVVLKDGEKKRFFLKGKYHTKEHVDFILGRRKQDSINSIAARDFDVRSRYALSGVLNEIILSKKIKEVIASDAVQKLVKKYGFDGIKFSEPVVALVGSSYDPTAKYIIYKHEKKSDSYDDLSKESYLEKLANDLRQIFFKNNIHPHDLKARQLMVIEQNGKPYIVLIDTEAYTKVDESVTP